MSWSVSGVENFPKGNNPMGNRFYGYNTKSIVLPDGRKAVYHGVDVGDCVHTVAVDDDETTYLVRQIRPNAWNGQGDIPETLELPGGFAHPELSLADSARLELQQEIGKDTLNLIKIGTLYPSPGISNEQDHIFLARDLTPIVDGLAEREATKQDMRIVTMPFGRAYDLFTSGREPVSAQTLAALSMAKRFL